MSEQKYSFYLFASPNFINGYGRILDVSGSYNTYNENATEKEADSIMLNNDWHAIGDDIKEAISIYGKEKEKKENCYA